eukprot:Opistho-2@58623
MLILSEGPSASPVAASVAQSADAASKNKSSLYKWRSYFQKRKAKHIIGLQAHCAVEVLGNATYERMSKGQKASFERVVGICNGFLIAFKPRGDSLKWQDLDTKFVFPRRAVKGAEEVDYAPLAANDVSFFTDPSGRRVIVRGRTREHTISLTLTGNQTFSRWENKLHELNMLVVKYDAVTFDCLADGDNGSALLRPATPKQAASSPKPTASGTLRLTPLPSVIGIASSATPTRSATMSSPVPKQIMVRASADNSVLVRRIAFDESLPTEQLAQMFSAEKNNQALRQSTAW